MGHWRFYESASVEHGGAPRITDYEERDLLTSSASR